MRLIPMKTSKSTWLMGFAGVLLLYILSVGPAYRMAAHRLIPNVWFVRVYEPVIRVGESVPFIHPAFDWYMRLWYDYMHPDSSKP